MPPAAAAAVLARSGGYCERCGRGAEQIHHRQPRGMGGTRAPAIHDPANLLHLCSGCHLWVETNRAAALAAGLLVSRYQDPADVPAHLWGRWYSVGADLNPNTTVEPPF